MKIDFDRIGFQVLKPEETKETLFTTAQLLVILLEFREHNVTPERFELFRKRGLFSDMALAIGQAGISYDPAQISRRKLRQLFGLPRLLRLELEQEPKGSLPSPKIIHTDYLTRVNYDRSLTSMIRSTKPDNVDQKITKERFPKWKSGIVKEKLRLVSMDDSESAIGNFIGLLDILSSMDSQGYSPASIEPLLALVSEDSDAAERTIYALGCNDYPDGMVPRWCHGGRRNTTNELRMEQREDHLLKIGSLLFVKRASE